MLTPCHERQPAQDHTYTVQIKDDGEANEWKCGRCGWVVAWDVGDHAEAFVRGHKILQEQARIGWMGTSGTDMEDHDY